MKMKTLLTLISLNFFAMHTMAEELVSLRFSHSMRIPNSNVQISVSSEGTLTVDTDSRGENQTTRKVQLNPDRVQELEDMLTQIKWKNVTKDKTKGFDGTVVKISYSDHSASIWTPEYDSRKRGLVEFQKVVLFLFDLAGLNEGGMPIGNLDEK